jgi:hypothetical protein
VGSLHELRPKRRLSATRENPQTGAAYIEGRNAANACGCEMEHEDRIQKLGDRIQKKMKKCRIQESESRRQEKRRTKEKGKRLKDKEKKKKTVQLVRLVRLVHFGPNHAMTQ